jgi:flagellar protein FlaG
MALDEIATIRGTAPAASRARDEAPPAESGAAAERSARAEERAAPAPPTQPDLSQVIANLTRALQQTQSNLSFSVDEHTGKTIVRVVRSSTGELVRQIPSEEALAIAASLAPGDALSSLGLDRWS